MDVQNLKVSILIPTYNAGARWRDVLNGIDRQTVQFAEKIVIDSGSVDNTIAMAKESGFTVISIPQTDFDHGYTRQILADKARTADICIFLTQDAIPADPNSMRKLIEVFRDEQIGLAYGRQLPHETATPLETHARLFNYPAKSNVRSFADKGKYGFKVFFCSNSFAAYRKTVLRDMGGFPMHSIMGEDALFAAKMLSNGYKLAYVAEATVRHSHNYTFKEEFKRYFDTRVFHEQNKWINELYGKPVGEGLRFVRSELQYILNKDIRFLFNSFSSTLAKWLGYKTGKYYKHLPPSLLTKLSMHKTYWHKNAGSFS